MDTLASPTTSSTVCRHTDRRQWRDETSGRTITQFTNAPEGAHLDYFRLSKMLPDGRFVAFGLKQPTLYLMDPDGAAPERIDITIPHREFQEKRNILRLLAGTWYFYVHRGRDLWRLDLRTGRFENLATIPDGIPGDIDTVAADGETVYVLNSVQDLTDHPIPTTMDLGLFWHFFDRPRHGEIYAWNWRTGETREIYRVNGLCPLHLEPSPKDPSLLRFCHDMYDAFGQRVWTVRADGTQLRAIRPQTWGELVTHEFWAFGGDRIAYTFQDRRNDPTLHDKPWAEYSPIATQFCLAELSGREIYRSHPLNSYHTHLFLSADGSIVTGEGTDGNSFVFAAPFALNNPTIDFKPMATIHTPYVPFRGQNVECVVTPDNRWLLYNDTIDGVLQICGIELDF